MNITATDAKNRLGQVLEQARSEPVFIEKGGRLHSVVMSVGHYDALVKAGQRPKVADAARFYETYKDWVDEQTTHFHQHGLWNDDLRSW